MTREQLVKYKFQAYTQITVTYPRNGYSFDGMLVSVNFDLETMEIEPFENDIYEYSKKTIHVSSEHCEITKYSALKVIKKKNE